MPFFTVLPKSDKAAQLVLPGNFEADYTLETVNCLIMGKENKPLQLQTQSEIALKQIVESKHIISHIRLSSISGNTENESLKTHLQQSLVLAEISPELVLRRNLKGAVTGVENLDRLKRDWRKWKENRLAEIVTEEWQQRRFIANYERGLDCFEAAVQHNLQYLLLLPECFHYKIYPSEYGEDRNKILQYSSRFIDGFTILYRLEKTAVEKFNPVVFRQESDIENRAELREPLKEFYRNHITAAAPESYCFFIQTHYEMCKESGEIVKGTLKLTEEIHEHLKYEIEIRVNKQ